MTVTSIIDEKYLTGKREEDMEKTIRNYLEEKKVRALVKVYPSDNLIEGISALVRGYGFGPVEPNTILLGDVREEEDIIPFAKLMKMIHDNQRNLIIIKKEEALHEVKNGRRIDIWWGQKGNNAWLMLALVHLLRMHTVWRGSRLVLKTIVSSENDRAEVEKGLRSFIGQARVEADVESVLKDEAGIFGTIQRHSRSADLVFVGLRPMKPEETIEDYGEYYKNVIRKTGEIPFIAYVLAAEDIDFRKIFSFL